MNTKIMEVKTFVASLCILLLSTVADSALWTQARDEYVKLHTAYVHTGNTEFYSDIVPRSTTNTPVDVTLRMEMFSLREFDAVNGALEIVGSLSMTWIDPIETLSATTTFDSSDVDSVLINYRKIWTPVMVLLNSAESVQRIGDDTYLARFNLSTGVVTWTPRVLLKGSCTPTVTFFPFDKHECDFIFSAWYQDSSKVRLLVSSGEWELGKYEDSGIWKKETTSSTATLINGYYYATFTINFSRQPLFFTINVVFPVLLLTVLSGFLFLLPVASGERVGFGIVCFLSFVVLLQSMVQFLPEISNPMSLLCFYAIIMMIFSGVLSIVNIILIRVYSKTDTEDMPKFLVHFLEVIKCVKCKRMRMAKQNSDDTDRKTEINGITEDDDVEAISMESEFGSESEASKSEKKVDWTSVGKLLDTFFITLFIGGQIGFTIIFLVPIFSNK